jgi:hypothetical protein
MSRRWPLLLWALVWLASRSGACDLCAIYNADAARDSRGVGWVATLSESFIPYRTVLLNGKEIHGNNLDFRDASVTHLVPGYNFTPRFGVNVNLPLVYQNFQRTEVRYRLTGPPTVRTERGNDFQLGDVSLIGRLALFQKTEMEYSFAADALAGVRFPTGETDRLTDEVSQTRIYDRFVPPGTPHDPLGHTVSGVHQHDLSPGSGSYDGLCGLTVRARWRRLFLNGQFQYYLHTEGASGFQYGDEIMISGGPGVYLLLGKRCTLNLQANASYDSIARDRILDRISDRTGSTSWYLGPQIGLSLQQRFSGAAGIDVPLHVTNNGLQNRPDYRVHVSLAYRF